MKYKHTRKKAIKQIYKQPLFTLDKPELMSLISNIEKDLLAQKEDKKECICNPFTKTITCPIHGIKSKTTPSPEKECKHNWKLTPDTWGETCFYCGKQRKIKTTPSPLEIEEIETLKHRFMSGKNRCWRELSLQDQKINSLIRNQKKLYQLIKEKQK